MASALHLTRGLMAHLTGPLCLEVALIFARMEGFYKVHSHVTWKLQWLSYAFVIDSIYVEQSHRLSFISPCPGRNLLNAASESFNQNLESLAAQLTFKKLHHMIQQQYMFLSYQLMSAPPSILPEELAKQPDFD